MPQRHEQRRTITVGPRALSPFSPLAPVILLVGVIPLPAQRLAIAAMRYKSR